MPAVNSRNETITIRIEFPALTDLANALVAIHAGQQAIDAVTQQLGALTTRLAASAALLKQIQEG